MRSCQGVRAVMQAFEILYQRKGWQILHCCDERRLSGVLQVIFDVSIIWEGECLKNSANALAGLGTAGIAARQCLGSSPVVGARCRGKNTPPPPSPPVSHTMGFLQSESVGMEGNLQAWHGQDQKVEPQSKQWGKSCGLLL